MSGHNKWKQIKERKAKTDAQKAKIFGRLAKLITEEARKVHGNLSSPTLKALIDRAKESNMPADNIDRAVKKATEKGVALEQVTYEAYGPGGVAMLIEVLTDNKNRSAQEIKAILSKQGFSLAAPGSASWAFTGTAEGRVPTSTVPLSDENITMLELLEEALDVHDDVQNVFTNAE